MRSQPVDVVELDLAHGQHAIADDCMVVIELVHRAPGRRLIKQVDVACAYSVPLSSCTRASVVATRPPEWTTRTLARTRGRSPA